MFKKGVFTVSIGNLGTAVSLHYGRHVKEKILVDKITPENRGKIKEIFDKDKSAAIHILLDTADQNFKRKIYPSVSRLDLNRIVSRDLKKEIPSNNEMVKGYLVGKNKKTNKWECLFVSSPNTEEANKWMDFIFELPNQIAGIHILPLEAYSLLEMIMGAASKTNELTKKSDITFFVIQSRISGIRQIAYDGKQIIFTRMVNYDLNSKNFSEEFEQDILRANEYLKRIIPGLKTEDVNIVTLLSEDIIKKISSIQKDLNFLSYSPYKAATIIGLSSSVSQNDSFVDFLLASTFVNAKNKVLRFDVPRISALEKVRVAIKVVFFANLFLLFLIFAFIGYVFYYNEDFNDTIKKLNAQKNAAKADYDRAEKTILEGEDFAGVDIDQLMDFGKINEMMAKNKYDLSDVYKRFDLFKKSGVIIQSFDFSVSDTTVQVKKAGETKTDIKTLSPTSVLQAKVTASGDLSIPSGDVEDLIKSFDSLGLKTNAAFPDYQVSYAELSKDLNFNKKYYNFPVSLKMTSK